jgi:hypothetical protein
MEIQLTDIGHTIQLAIAPVFLLTGVGTSLTVQTNRLARIVDRSRVLEERLWNGNTSPLQTSYEIELETLYQRIHLINRAITLSTSSALLVCLVIATLFAEVSFSLALSKFIALLFVLAMFALIGSFIYLLREIFLAIRTTAKRYGPNRLKKQRFKKSVNG